MIKTHDNLPPLNWLRAFEAAARHLSFTLAARELNLTQSAVSQHVRNLESWLGHDLFARKTRALSLTEAGANYLPVVREAFDVLANGTRAFAGNDRGSVLHLNCNMAFATWWLAPRIASLHAAAPWLKINIQTATWGFTKEPGNSDMEIRFGRSEDMSANAERILKESVTPVCAPNYADGNPDWRRHALWDCAGSMSGWHAWVESQGNKIPDTQSINLASTFVVSLTIAASGQGLALAHHFMIQGIRRTSPLIEPWPHRLPIVEAYFLSPPSPHAETPATRMFTEWLNSELESDSIAA